MTVSVILCGNVEVTMRVDGAAARRARTRRAGAGVADPDDQRLGPQRLEGMAFLEVRLQLADQLLLDVQHSTAHLTHGMVMITCGQLVVRRSLAKVGGIDRS